MNRPHKVFKCVPAYSFSFYIRDVQNSSIQKSTRIRSTLIFFLTFFMYVPILWFHDPLTALVSLITITHYSISAAFCLHYLTFVSYRSFSVSSSHLSLGLPLILLPSGLLSNILLTVLFISVHVPCIFIIL